MARILIADDSSYQRGRLRKVIEAWGHQTLEATSGKEALVAVANEALDAILLDLIMPEVQGFDVLRELQGRPDVAPIIVITADIQDDVRAECLALGAAVFINKPVKPEQLQTALNSLLGSRESSGNASHSS